MGWERANWFAPDGDRAADGVRLRTAELVRPRGARASGRARDGGTLRPDVLRQAPARGPDAGALLDRLAANDVAVPIGRTVYTPLLNARGGYESDLTVSHVGPDTWFVVTGSAQRVRDADWIRRHATPDLRVPLTDQTEAWATLGLMGPRARDVLARVTDADLSNAAFPYGTVREITVAGAAVRAIRVSYAGELGWELYVPSADATGGVGRADGRRRRDAGRLLCARLAPDREGLPRVGTRADARRHAVAGRARLHGPARQARASSAATRSSPSAPVASSRRLLLFALDDPDVVAWGDEPIYRNDELVGTLTSAAHGHTLGRAVAMGYVRCTPGESPAESVVGGRYEIDMAGTPGSRRYRCEPGTIRPARDCVAERIDRRRTPDRNEPTSGAGDENRDAGGARGHPGGSDHGRRRAAAAHRDDVRARAGQHLPTRVPLQP